jgi:hypothetical protein
VPPLGFEVSTHSMKATVLLNTCSNKVARLFFCHSNYCNPCAQVKR